MPRLPQAQHDKRRKMKRDTRKPRKKPKGG